MRLLTHCGTSLRLSVFYHYWWESCFWQLSPNGAPVQEGCQREIGYRWKLPVTPEQRTLAAMETMVESQRTQLCWPYIWPLRKPWSCTFCQIEDLKKCCSDSQPIYQESEILQKQMVSREQLVSWNANLSPLLAVYTREGAPSCREQEEDCPRQTAVPCCVLITLPDTETHKPQKIPILCLFGEVCRFGGLCIDLSICKSSFFPSCLSLKNLVYLWQKCEFLLLKLYCSPKSSFFVSEPRYVSNSNKNCKLVFVKFVIWINGHTLPISLPCWWMS